MTGRERVRASLSLKPFDRVPKDLGAMASTGISCFAYPRLVEALGLPPRLPRVFDTGQMLALPDADVLDALDCDCVFLNASGLTNAFPQPERWKHCDFGGRLPALVEDPAKFRAMSDGSVVQDGNRTMVAGSFVFDAPHGGQPVNLDEDPPLQNLDAIREGLRKRVITDEEIERIAGRCRAAREATDRAIMFNGFQTGIGFPGGMAHFSMVCLLHPEHVRELHDMVAEDFFARMKTLLPAIAQYVDLLMLSADDHGTQNATILPPEAFADLYMPAYRKINDELHRVAPGVFTFLHSCGAIYEILDHVVGCGFDAVNPVQWPAGGHSAREWKDKCRGRIAMWGGGIDTQHELPFATPAEVRRQAAGLARLFSEDSGYVFCAIHNLLAEVPPEKVIALYEGAAGHSLSRAK
jgi:uroporphyrinogen decarboxylase